MICIHLNTVLLITPDERLINGGSLSSEETWTRIEPGVIGQTLRQVLQHQPEVLVFDLSKLHDDSNDYTQMLGMIKAVRARLPGVKIAALGSDQRPEMEPVVRQQGVTVYIPISHDQGPGDAREMVRALYSRHGPSRSHSPPYSGVPPRA